MKIKGLQKVTLIDYPEKIACTIFLFGCNFGCPFCHNPELVSRDLAEELRDYTEEEILNFLENRRGLLDGVCITGGEPTLNPELPELIEKIKSLGYSVKLDTNGSNPDMLKRLIANKLVDYIAMDIKVPLSRYTEFCENPEKIKESISLIMQFPDVGNSEPHTLMPGIPEHPKHESQSNRAFDYEFRTTVLPKIHSKEDIINIANDIKGARKYVIQQFRQGKTLDPDFKNEKTFSVEELNEMKNSIKDLIQNVKVRVNY